MRRQRMTDEQFVEARHDARIRREAKAMDALERRETKAEQMIGELNSGTFYVYPVGGKYREGSRADLIAFLLRNNYV